MFSLIEVNNQKDLDSFVITQGGDFLQSWDWGLFQAGQGFRPLRLAVLDQSGQYLAVLTLLKKPLPLGHYYWFAPRGPVLHRSINSDQLSQVWHFLLEQLKITAKQDKIAFLRFEPPVTDKQSTYSAWQSLVSSGNVFQTISLEPQQTIMLDLSLAESELLAKMHHKTRYNIRLAQKKSIKVSVASAADFDIWWSLLTATSKRDGFRLHSQDYYRRMLAMDGMKLYLARHHAEPLAGILVNYFGQTATYVHGASANQNRELMAPYLLQWQAICDAQSAGLANYDFYGVDARKWPGVTRFKEGFSGQNLAYLGTFDLVWLVGYYKFYSLLRSAFRTISKFTKKFR